MTPTKLALLPVDNLCEKIQVTESNKYHGSTYYNGVYIQNGYFHGRPVWNWNNLATITWDIVNGVEGWTISGQNKDGTGKVVRFLTYANVQCPGDATDWMYVNTGWSGSQNQPAPELTITALNGD